MSARVDSDVVVIGGGLIGCSIAWRLAQRGASVTLVERDHPGRAASWAAAGWLSPYGYANQNATLASLALRSLDAFPAFVEELHASTGISIEYGAPGRMELSEQPPQLYDRDAFVDSRQLSEAAALAAKTAGVRQLVGSAVIHVSAHDSTNRLKLSTGETLNCSRVVIAAGAWSGELTGLGRQVPVSPVRGQMLSVQHDGTLQHILHAEHCYLIPRSGGRVLIGATVEHDGFEPPPTDQPLRDLHAAALELVPSLAGAPIIETWFGFRPRTPDDLPILGPDPEMPGIVYATGHYRNGILLAPITAELIARVVERNDVSELRDFGIDRFGHE